MSMNDDRFPYGDKLKSARIVRDNTRRWLKIAEDDVREHKAALRELDQEIEKLERVAPKASGATND